MYISSMHRVPAERLRRSRMDGHIRSPYRRKDTQCVIGGLLEGGIAVDGADAEEGKARVVGGEEDGKGVLKAAALAPGCGCGWGVVLTSCPDFGG